MIEMALMEHSDAGHMVQDQHLWDCLTCGKCTNYCPTSVYFPEFVRSVRRMSLEKGNYSVINHTGITYHVAEAMANNDLTQKRLGWINGTNIAKKADILFFTGCLPYFDVTFRPLGIDGGANILNNAVKIMNRAGIVPAVMADEVCCGHDQIWSGDMRTFTALAKRNMKAIERTGAKRIVTICPECTTTLKNDYAEHINVNLDVVHITQFLAELIKDGKLVLRKNPEKVTYHDPCRLVQHLGVVDAPRTVIKAIDPEGFVEMRESGVLASCCGTTLWRGCDALSEVMRHDRLEQAMETGASTLLTACPKCQIHFRCTLSTKLENSGLDPNLKVKDIVTFVAENMEG
jgi:Fe-S oxidoreductase